MSIEISCKCNNCKNKMDDGEDAFCYACYDEATDTIAKLEAEIAELECIIDAWHTIFGTTQLTHAEARLEQAEVDRLKYKTALEEIAEKMIVNEIHDIAQQALQGEK